MYVEDAYFKAETAKSLIKIINNREERMAEAKRKYEVELEKIKANYLVAIQDLEALKVDLETAGKDTKLIVEVLKEEEI